MGLVKSVCTVCRLYSCLLTVSINMTADDLLRKFKAFLNHKDRTHAVSLCSGHLLAHVIMQPEGVRVAQVCGHCCIVPLLMHALLLKEMVSHLSSL